MQWIQKQNEPRQLTEWRSRFCSDINFGYDLLRKDKDATDAVHISLITEQGWICAYTGVRIEADSSHIEHVKPQAHCEAIETVTYTNIVACYPAPNQSCKTPYGAEQKGKWPAPAEEYLFVSPLDSSCESRFSFNLRGEIKSKQQDDLAAITTISKLGLNCDKLKAYRKAAIQGTLGDRNQLSLKEARQRLKHLQKQRSGKLEPFCFVLIQALEKHIKRLEVIQAQSKKKS
jgi:uncharacterized protein (TIGR02646 family)